MNNHRQSALAGLLAVGLFAVGTLISGSPPHPGASVSQLTEWMIGHRSGIVLGWLIASAGFVPLLVLGLGLGARLWASERHRLLTIVAGVCWTSLLLIFGLAELPLVAVVWRGAPFDPAVTRAAFDIWSVGSYAGTAVLAAGSIGLPCWIGLRSGSLPRWLVVFGAFEVIANAVELAGALDRTGTNAAGYSGGVAPILWSLWAGAAAVAMWRLNSSDSIAPELVMTAG